MKRLRYYAPYWVSAIIITIVIVISVLLFGRITPFSELPQLAAALESDDYFIREDGVIMKAAGKSATGVSLKPTGQHWVGKIKAKELHEMLPHEYAALISDKDIYVRKDGRVFAQHISYPGLNREYALPICPPSKLPDDSADAEIEIISEHDWWSARKLASITVRTPVENNEAALDWYLSVKLSDSWYIISEGTHYAIIVDENSAPYFYISASFPALHEGDYRLEFNTGSRWSYREITLTRRDTDNYTLAY